MEVKTYAEATKIIDTCANGHFQLLVIVGPPGTAKTTLVKKLMNGSAHWINGSVTAFQFYRELWRHPDALFVIDDVDGLCGDAAMVRLLKAVCDTAESRTVRWMTATPQLSDDGDEEKPPREFETTARLVIITNDWSALNKNVAAVNDRAIVIEFAPSAQEIHQQAAIWCEDAEIIQFIGDHLHLLGGHHSLRYYVQAAEFKKAQLDWRNLLVRTWRVDPKVACVMRLLADKTKTQEERAAIFTAEGHGCRRTYYYICNNVRDTAA